MVNFKIRPSSFSHKFVVCEGLTRPFIVGEEFLSQHCFTLGGTDKNRRFAKYKNKVIAVVSQSILWYQQNVQICFQVEWKHFHALNSDISSQTYIWNQCNMTMQILSGKMSSPT